MDNNINFFQELPKPANMGFFKNKFILINL